MIPTKSVQLLRYIESSQLLSGGAACINSSTVTILNRNFSGNVAYGQGGVFHIEHSTLYVWKSIFSGNKAKYPDSGLIIDYASGGVISSTVSSVAILISESSLFQMKQMMMVE